MKAKVTLMLTVLALLLFGIVMIYSTSGPFAEQNYGHANYFIVRHAVWVVLGRVACGVGATVDYHVWMRWVWPILGFTAVLLAIWPARCPPIPSATITRGRSPSSGIRQLSSLRARRPFSVL